MGATFTEQFTDGLSRQNYQYVADSNVQYNIESRAGFANINGMPNATGGPNTPVHMRTRYLHLQATTPVQGKILKRKVPCQTSAIITYFQALERGTGGNATINNLDGQSWTVMGYTGEYFHKSRG